MNNHLLSLSEEDIRNIEERLSMLYTKSKSQCASSNERDYWFAKYMEAKMICTYLDIVVSPPNNRNRIHVEIK